MIDIPVHNLQGKQIDTFQLDEQLLGGEVRPALLKQAYVRYHANQRLGTSKTKKRSEVAYSTRKLYKQKGTGNARRGSAQTNILRHGAHGHSKKPHSWRQKMPVKMRRLANRNALLAKAVDGQIKLVDQIKFEKPSTKQFADLLASLNIDRSCLLALTHTTSTEARSARNLSDIKLTNVEQLNAFDLLNNRYVLVERAALENWIAKQTASLTEQDVDIPTEAN
ncbi:MAG: 50S ribosomal protein L4 [Phycisphaera sp.]|nr:50S ribosomal protein L4 [Phycisphaera sp.]